MANRVSVAADSMVHSSHDTNGTDSAPLFSIVIPTFNAGQVVGNALESVRTQSCDRVEVIVVDGCSSDNTETVVRSYEDKLNLVYHSEPDRGVYDAMNRGISFATGRWLYFLGADDSLLTSSILEQVARHARSTEAAVIYGSVRVTGDTGWAKDGDIYDGEFTTEKLIRKNLCHQSVFYDREFLIKNAGEFNIRYRVCADWDLNLRCWAKTPFSYVDLVVTEFNAGGTSTNAGDTAHHEDFLDNIVAYFGISAFDPLINNEHFLGSPKLVELQKKESFVKYLLYSLKRRLSHSAGQDRH